jgi:beta-N-acetylhexosaminidase
MRVSLLLVTLGAAGLCCAHQPPAAEPAALPVAPDEAEGVERLLASLSLEQKVGQLMMVGFAGQEVDEGVRALVQGRQVGGVCLFSRNLASAAQVARLNDELRALLVGQVPPFLAVDQEGGNVVRLDVGNLVLPGNMLLGATFDPALAYEAGLRQGEDLWRLGFNMNLAPVLDVNSNPRNPVIGIRAFSDDVDLVSRLGAPFVQGQQAAHIATIAKHFPGHGSVDRDSHRSLPVLEGPPERIRAQLAPFAAAAAVGLDGMMTAHVAAPALSGDDTPATLSSAVLGRVLREEMRFDGLVLTDELEMDAIHHRYGVGPAAVLAVVAGADMVLIPWRLEKKTEVHEALLAAARSGELPPERLDQALRRILSLKWRRGLFAPLPPREQRLKALGSDRDLADRIARAGVTMLRQTQAFPVDPRRRVGVVTAEASLADALARRVPRLERLVVPAYPPEAARDGLKRAARALALRSDVVVVGVTNSRQLELAAIATLAGRPVVVVVMGAPYLAAQVHGQATVLLVYSYRASAAEAAAGALLGELGTPGRLPVALPGSPLGSGLDPVGARAAMLRRPAARPPAGTSSAPPRPR